MNPEPPPGPARILQRLEEGFLVLLMGAMVLLAFTQIILRNFFSTALFWADPLIRHLVLWTSFLGALIATRREKHIKIDVLLRFLSPAKRRLIEGLTEFFSALVCGLLTWISLRFIGDESAYGGREFLDIPTWKLQLIFPLTFGLMALRFLFQAGRDLLKFRGQA